MPIYRTNDTHQVSLLLPLLTNTTETLFYNTVQDFCAAYISFLDQVDDCIDLLRAGTGLALGLGMDSPCIERAERKSLARLQLHDGSKSCRPKSRKMFLVARRTLGVCLAAHQQALDVLLEDSSPHDGATPDLPKVLTLTWLSLCRRNLGQDLSFLLSNLVSPDPARVQKIMNEKDWTERLKLASTHARESQQYLAHTFSLRLMNAAPSLGKFCKAFDESYVALWTACQEHSTDMKDISTTRTSSSEAGLVQSVQVWFATSFEGLVEKARQMQEEMSEKEQGEAEQNHDRHLSPSTMKEHESSRELYEHVGDTTSSLPKKTSSGKRSRTNKTLVYAGTGTVPRQQQSLETEPLFNGDSTLTSSNAAVQNQMLQELQTRLATISLHEEDATGPSTELEEQNIMDENQTALESKDPAVPMVTKNKESKKTSKAPMMMFLGVSTEMLREAQQTIARDATENNDDDVNL